MRCSISRVLRAEVGTSAASGPVRRVFFSYCPQPRDGDKFAVKACGWTQAGNSYMSLSSWQRPDLAAMALADASNRDLACGLGLPSRLFRALCVADGFRRTLASQLGQSS